MGDCVLEAKIYLELPPLDASKVFNSMDNLDKRHFIRQLLELVYEADISNFCFEVKYISDTRTMSKEVRNFPKSEERLDR